MKEKILLGMAVFALAGIMVPITADATHNETHKTKMLVVCGEGICQIFIDRNNDGGCEIAGLTHAIIDFEKAVKLIDNDVIAFCGS